MTDQDVVEFFGPLLLERKMDNVNIKLGRAMMLQQLAADSDDDDVTIPTTFHFIWLGVNEMPFKEAAESSNWNEPMISWKVQHEEFNITLWTDSDDAMYKQWYNKRAFLYAMDHGMYGMASDIMRLEILFKIGGVYVDIDYYCIDSVWDLLRGKDFVCGASNTGCIELNNGFMAAISGHGVVKEMMESIHGWFDLYEAQSQQMALTKSFLDATTAAALDQAWQLSHNDIIDQTGPGLLTRTISSVLLTGEATCTNTRRIAILHHKVLHPVPNSVRGAAAKLAMDAYIVPGMTKAIHLWGCSWQNNHEESRGEKERANIL